jgi:hypothetical protein
VTAARHRRRRIAAALVTGGLLAVLPAGGSAAPSPPTPAAATTLHPTAQLTGSGETGDGDFGQSVAMAADGSVALVGAPYDRPQPGALEPSGNGLVWVFTESAAGWTPDARLFPTGAIGFGDFGMAVALAADGREALVGAPGEAGGVGAAYVFVRSGLGWAQQARLTGADATAGAAFGSSLALSADGTTALIGGPRDCFGEGAAWVFARSANRWQQQGAKLVPPAGCAAGDLAGVSVALSGDGDTALVGAPAAGGIGRDPSSATPAAPSGPAAALQVVGDVLVYTRSGAVWSAAGDLVPTSLPAQVIAGAGFGAAVALTTDAGMAVVGVPDAGGTAVGVSGRGAVVVFTRSGATWDQLGPALTADDESDDGGFGTSVSVSADGSMVLVGAPEEASGRGAVWAFARSGSRWSQQGGRVTVSGETGAGGLGTGLALASQGAAALIGAPTDTPGRPLGPAEVAVGAGAAWVLGATGGVVPSPASASGSAGLAWLLALLAAALLAAMSLGVRTWRCRRPAPPPGPGRVGA